MNPIENRNSAYKSKIELSVTKSYSKNNGDSNFEITRSKIKVTPRGISIKNEIWTLATTSEIRPATSFQGSVWRPYPYPNCTPAQILPLLNFHSIRLTPTRRPVSSIQRASKIIKMKKNHSGDDKSASRHGRGCSLRRERALCSQGRSHINRGTQIPRIKSRARTRSDSPPPNSSHILKHAKKHISRSEWFSLERTGNRKAEISTSHISNPKNGIGNLA